MVEPVDDGARTVPRLSQHIGGADAARAILAETATELMES
jgi:hypothetical protein